MYGSVLKTLYQEYNTEDGACAAAQRKGTATRRLSFLSAARSASSWLSLSFSEKRWWLEEMRKKLVWASRLSILNFDISDIHDHSERQKRPFVGADWPDAPWVKLESVGPLFPPRCSVTAVGLSGDEIICTNNEADLLESSWWKKTRPISRCKCNLGIIV